MESGGWAPPVPKHHGCRASPCVCGGPTGSHGAALPAPALPAPARPPASCSRRGTGDTHACPGGQGWAGGAAGSPPSGRRKHRVWGHTGDSGEPFFPLRASVSPFGALGEGHLEALLAKLSALLGEPGGQGGPSPEDPAAGAHTGVSLSQATPLHWAPDDDGDGDNQALMASALCPTLCRAHPRDPSMLLRCLRRKLRPGVSCPRTSRRPGRGRGTRFRGCRLRSRTDRTALSCPWEGGPRAGRGARPPGQRAPGCCASH